MARGNPYRFQRFARGLNTADNVFNLADGLNDDTGRGAEARDLLNVTSRSRGNVGKRDGSTTVKARGGIKDFSPVDADTAALAIYSTTAGALFALDETGAETTLVASGLSGAAPWTFLHLPMKGTTQGPYYGANGVDAPRQVSGALAVANWTATAGTLPNGNMMCYAGNRLWVIPASDPYAIVWSDIQDPTSWPAENITRFSPDDGQKLTGIVAFGNSVLVFKERAIWAVYNLDTSANRKLTDEAGTLSFRSIVATDGGCYFMDAERGVLVTDGQTVKEISPQILPTIRRISAADQTQVTATYWQGHLFFTARLDGSRRVLFDYHLELDSWWLHSHQARVIGAWDRGLGRELFAAHPDTLARLFVPGEALDEGVVFRSYWSGPFHDFGSSVDKRCTEVRLDGSGHIDLYALADFFAGQGNVEGNLPLTGTGGDDVFGGGGLFGGAGVFGGGLTVGQDSLYSLGLGRVWSVTFGNESIAPWEIDAYTMFMTSRKD